MKINISGNDAIINALKNYEMNENIQDNCCGWSFIEYVRKRFKFHLKLSNLINELRSQKYINYQILEQLERILKDLQQTKESKNEENKIIKE